ncbi:MAG: hypothetical protein ABR555_02710 [Pyrinomonadaceae bacterium]
MKLSNERGSARLKFLIVAATVGAMVYAGFVYLPFVYKSYQYKDLMQHYVDVAVALGHPPTWVGEQLTKNGPEYDIPADAVITPLLENNRVEVRVQFTWPVEFPGYTYQYDFDYTAKSLAFLDSK